MQLSLYSRFLSLPEHSMVVIADVHIGYGRQESGVATYDEHRLVDHATQAVDEAGADQIVLAGDTLHRFGENHPDTFDVLHELFDTLNSQYELTVLPGNHDEHRFEAAPFSDVPTTQQFSVDSATIVHGHHALPDGDPVIIGHLHPVLTVQGDRWPCFLKGSYQNRTVLVLPAFNRYTAGAPVSTLYHDVHEGALDARDLHGLKPIVVDPDTNQVRTFPTLRAMHEHGFAR